MARETYQRPAVEIVEVRVERGFAQSVEVSAQVESYEREAWHE